MVDAIIPPGYSFFTPPSLFNYPLSLFARQLCIFTLMFPLESITPAEANSNNNFIKIL
jgi:hypothetical protein